MWEINSYNQYTCFLYSIIMGAAVEIVYDLFKIDRALFKRNKVFIFLSDILFWIITSFILFSFCVVFSNGQIRGYIIFGTLIGFIIFRLTFSKAIWCLIKPARKLINKLSIIYLNLINNISLIISRTTLWIRKITKNPFLNKKEKNNQIIKKNS